ncbi:uncharacterized protein LOC127807959 isoform X2 [Diospyros lotus]|uniref:uncharacterized protein LOC127807959 isoform X2 n=1 Tax=Diospyros lotus TaxID=55363 RepID=UPI00225609D3|nr:uncharacterized protein LOC127807959 isoform X2 [Diospyros lotus]
MSFGLRKSASNGWCRNPPISEDQQQEKVEEVRRVVGPLPEKLSIYCSNASISRYLRAQNWDTKKATKMLEQSLKWRLEYKPEEIRWDQVASEAETGNMYRAPYTDKQGRAVLVMRPICQNSKSTIGSQIRYLVYCMENAIMNLEPSQEAMAWLIDFRGCSLSNISVKIARETAHILQYYYPGRLSYVILYNPPKFFESFWRVVKRFLDPRIANKVKFVCSENQSSVKIMEDLFDMDKLDSAFGGRGGELVFDINRLVERMREDDKKMRSFWGNLNACEADKCSSCEAHGPEVCPGCNLAMANI